MNGVLYLLIGLLAAPPVATGPDSDEGTSTDVITDFGPESSDVITGGPPDEGTGNDFEEPGELWTPGDTDFVEE